MKENPYRENNEEMDELLQQYDELRAGRSHRFLDEEAFEKIISFYDEKEDLQKALEASVCALDQYPFSSSLLLKKADILLSLRHYSEALEVLEQAELLDRGDINLYILKTDVWLALDQHEKAVNLLEKALTMFEGEERLELLFELADVYDDYEEFDKVFDCLKLVLEQDPNNEEALYKICFWTLSFTGKLSTTSHTTNLHGSIWPLHTRD